MLLTDQQWVSGLIAALAALGVYVLGVRSTARGKRFDELGRAVLKLNEAAILLASEVSRREQDPSASVDLRPLQRDVRAAGAGVQLATSRRDILLRSAVVVRTAWQMRRAVDHPDDPVELWPWWRFPASDDHDGGRRCPWCPSGVQPPVTLQSAGIRDADGTVRRMGRLLDDLTASVATEVARGPFAVGQRPRRALARLLEGTGGGGARGRSWGASWTLVRVRRWRSELPDRLRRRGAPDRDELDAWLRHYGCFGFGDPRPPAGPAGEPRQAS